jgi:anti-sigma factor RsiW
MTPRFNDTSSECAAHTRMLDPYVDGELSPGHASDMTAHVLRCPVCKESAAFARALKMSLRRTAASASRAAPPSLRSRVASLLADARRRKESASASASAAFEPTRAPRVPMRYAMALAALTGALVAAGVSRIRAASLEESNLKEAPPASAVNQAGVTVGIEEMLDDLIALHKRPPAPETTNPEELPRFDLEVGVPVRRPAFQPPLDAQFKGARLYMSREGRAALLQYKVKGDHRVSVYVFDPRALPMMSAPSLNRRVVRDRPVYVGRRGGYSIAAAEQGGVGIALATDLPDEESTNLVLAAIP